LSNAHVSGELAQPAVIVGAGIAGLSAALHLAERGVRPLVLEADPLYCGGRVAGCETVGLDGWQFRGDHGVHAVWSAYRNLQAMLARHQIRPMLVPAQEECWIYRRRARTRRADVGSAIRHSWIPAPFHYLNLFLRPAFLGMLTVQDWMLLPMVWYGLVLSIGIDPLGEDQPMEGMWLSDLVKNWSPALRAFFAGLARNGLPARPQEVPISGFVAFLRFYTVLRRDAWAFAYLPADGGTSLAEPLADKVRELGGIVKMGTTVTHLERAPDGWVVHWHRDLSGGTTRARQVILATDAPHTAQLLCASPALTDDVAELYWPRGMATAAIRFWFDRAPDPGAEAGILSGDFTVHNFFWLHRIQDQYARWHRETGGSALEVHIYGPPELLEESDTILLLRALADVESAFPALRGHRLLHTIRRNPPTHTLFGVGPAHRHLGVETPWQNLFCCGDWVRHPSPAFFMERACVTGIEAANAVLQSRDLPAWPLLTYAPPDPLAGWIEQVMLRGRRRIRKRRQARLQRNR
jgi:isorenieratene synthase